MGSNLSTQKMVPRELLEHALELFADEGLTIRARSSFFANPAFPAGSGPDFLNGIVIVESELTPEQILEALHRIEAMLGRMRTQRWGPRAIDLDLIACGNLVLPDVETVTQWMTLRPEEQLQRTPQSLLLPHPRMQDRAFVLVPMAEIVPEWAHPVTGLTVHEMLAALPSEQVSDVLVIGR
ncbi:2-amino-4-hydroxy-6-hydroxymethyldihydropteridine diphosphokinase [Algicella marina]|uniref:2-amino-4-hydroxy-6-hydroxymethyldihydropteridine pyrophosphokinase n=2 Tax=Algicella marina TaxID=2683284 RepID=A0A6P1T729_9RHOB|nr:2-amino-4-hydroxy-6-hydroxymethyldihydropteridine diphosphokinase [Algicella marina]